MVFVFTNETDTMEGDEKKREKARKRCAKKFLYYFRKGYEDATYIEWERDYKWQAHLEFRDKLDRKTFEELIRKREFKTVADIAVKLESRTNLLFSFEKMALRDAVKSKEGAALFSQGLFDYVYGSADLKARFETWVDRVGRLPRKQTRVLTWPLVTVFGFIGNPEEHMFLKPKVTKEAAAKYLFPFEYTSKPNWNTYQSLLAFAEQVRKDTKSIRPKDYIDLQSFIWVMGSDEYPD
jgi:hypothetical protein